MNATTAARTYAKIGIESGVTAADPHKLISMLYQGALLAIANAKNSILRNDVSAKCAAISKAIAIIDEGLNASLDKNVGGSLAQNLSSLYEYMGIRLMVANLKNDMAALDEVARLLADLKEAWENIRPNAMQAVPQPKRAEGEFRASEAQRPNEQSEFRASEAQRSEFRGTAKPAPDMQPNYGRV